MWRAFGTVKNPRDGLRECRKKLVELLWKHVTLELKDKRFVDQQKTALRKELHWVVDWSMTTVLYLLEVLFSLQFL
jgi:hypothetical protein